MEYISSYSKIFALGHRLVRDIFDGPVKVQEKIDGSQISFGVSDGELMIRSKGAKIYPESPPKMFNKAVATIQSLQDKLEPDHIYRGEYLSKPKHNTLAYDRVPKQHIILFDVERTGLYFLSDFGLNREAERLGLEVAPMFCEGTFSSAFPFKEYMDRTSILGGQKVEGLVIKNYHKFTDDKKVMMAKIVSTEFQEKHQRTWKKSNPNRADVVQRLIATYATPARWQKAVQHLREADELVDAPQDIGKLIGEVKRDVRSECEEEIKQVLFDHFWKSIERGVAVGLPEWYKTKLSEE